MPARFFFPTSVERRWRPIGAVLVATLMLVMATLAVLVSHQRGEDQATRNEVAHSYVVRANMHQVFSLAQDVETGSRGFLITGQDAYREPYDRATPQIEGELKQLRASAQDADDRAQIGELERLVRLKLDISRQNIALRKRGPIDEATARVRMARGKQVMDQIRTLLARSDAHEKVDLDRRLAAVDAANHELTLTLRSLAAAVAVIIGVGVWGAAALAKAREQADAANQAKSAFLAMMSHELRTPLNGVLGMAHALAASPLDDRQSDYVEVITSSGQGLLAILNDILDLSKIEAGRMEIEAITYCLPDLLNSIAALWTAPAAEKGLTLTLELEDVPTWVTGDPTRLRQVLTNLLSNALKFTEQGHIRLLVRYGAEGRLSFEVADTGSGMSPAVQARIFREFSQGDASMGRKFGGTGLGLAISRRLCRFMGGDLEARSMEGVGSTFIGSVLAPTASAAVPESAAEARDAVPELRILAVDDNASNRAVIEALLHALGLPVTLACDGADALDALRSMPIDLVLMDINMPVMNGLDALAAIRAGKAGAPGVRVVALTADAMPGDRERYLAKGFDGHLSKPIQPSALVAALVDAQERLSRARQAGQKGLAA